ncbi:glutaredoxin [Iodidimonas gelatinilytica]|uniref:Glutaredoxin n=1 Tax=Iodidimonas gelatinilytica TaxID=1236966 RepID=A0A5A7N073_9PROT|nr:glutaredoxin 3 [Iodidimonas gelatinilytica]GEQ99250.1 glutaredoxin [Iodidimonas gelatinilytica]GER01054.1 glutaredoxin [Iodidimonas gelatinilytica]
MAKIDIYTKAWCPYCVRAKGLLKRKQQSFSEIDIGSKTEKRAEMIARSGGASTVPQIFIDGKHVGGCDDLVALDRAGKLDALLGA